MAPSFLDIEPCSGLTHEDVTEHHFVLSTLLKMRNLTL
jgi:hypothetical protein